jgi:hypothetical protein
VLEISNMDGLDRVLNECQPPVMLMVQAGANSAVETEEEIIKMKAETFDETDNGVPTFLLVAKGGRGQGLSN